MIEGCLPGCPVYPAWLRIFLQILTPPTPPQTLHAHTALGLALGAKPAIKKTHAMSVLATDQPAESNSAARKRLRAARPAPPTSFRASKDPLLESSSARVTKKQRSANPDYDDAYRNLLERTEGQARSQAFHRQEARKRRAQGKTRNGLIAPPIFVDMGVSPSIAAAVSAGATLSSVGEFVDSLCAGLEKEQREEEDEKGQVKKEGRRRRNGPGGKHGMGDEEVVARGPKKHNPFASLGSCDEDDEDEQEGNSPGVVFQPSVLQPSCVLSSQSQPLDQDTTGSLGEAPPKPGGETGDKASWRGQNIENDWSSLSMEALSSSLLDVGTLPMKPLSISPVDNHERKRENNDLFTSATSEAQPPLPIFVHSPVTASKDNVEREGTNVLPVISEGGNGEGHQVSTHVTIEDFHDL